MFIGNKKCRIYAACGVSQTPMVCKICEERILHEEKSEKPPEKENVFKKILKRFRR